jgi:3,4-dihydroxy 2-butanone 4-phosphate synthase/GTP cyclohydrolase II
MADFTFDPIEEVIEEIKKGNIIIMVDDDDREAEGDFICAADTVTGEQINFMVTHGRGLVCTALSSRKVSKLGLSMMPSTHNSPFPTAFTISVDAIENVTTGISAQERALTSRLLADENANAKDFASPGHTFPLRAVEGGVLKRAGHTEASVDIAVLAGRAEAAVICEIMNEDGTMARLPQLAVMAKELGLKLTSTNELIEYRRRNEVLVVREAAPVIPTKYGTFQAYAYIDKTTGAEHMAMVNGEISSDEPVNVRVHSECLTGDVLGSKRCDCGEQLDFAMKYIAEHGGVVLYLRNHEGRGIGLANKMKAYELQEKGFDTVDANLELGFEADLRCYGIGAQILSDLGVCKMNLLTNNPEKVSGLKGFKLEVVSRVPIEIPHNEDNKFYLNVKRDRMGHVLSSDD